MSITKKPIAWFHWHLYVTCPHCDTSIDLVPRDYDHTIAGTIFSKEEDWAGLNDYEVTCPECRKEFQIEKVSY